MDDKTLLYFGALLHDVGKVIYRGISGKGTHSKLGADFVRDEIALGNQSFATSEGDSVIEQIRYHHAREISSAANLSDKSLAYITYFADNISAGMDRKNEGDESDQVFFDKTVQLRKIFNILNGRHDDNTVGAVDYNKTRENIKRNLLQITISPDEVNSLMHLLEATCSDVPSSTNVHELIDVSLYDHAKTTAGIAVCVYDYLKSAGVENYRQALFSKEESGRYYSENIFLLASLDMSGIQDFIYTISGSGALKQLRARSMYLEVMMEHIADELLERLELSRANLLYTGGGHAYLLLPNTQETMGSLTSFREELKQWFLEKYATDLYMGIVWQECSADDLSNRSDDKQRFSRVFTNLAQKMSQVKSARYNAADVFALNFGRKADDSTRECSECHRAEFLLEDKDICPLCESLGAISKDLARKDVFAVLPAVDDGSEIVSRSFVLPFNCILRIYFRDEYLFEKVEAKRVYSKNAWDMGLRLATHIWMGDYAAQDNGEGISSYADHGVTLSPDRGINRLGVVRADVDNLGSAFAHGFPADKVSISRVATLSRSLSWFFKYRINEVMKAGGYRLQIIYSGGDDLFLVGNWSDVIYAAIDINKALKDYTGNGCLTISAGIGMFPAKYPIARMASEVGSLEDAAKLFAKETTEGAINTKNAVVLWNEDAVFGWDDFSGEIEPRVREIADIFSRCEKGKAFIYKMVELLRSFDDVISAPRLAYLLARSFEDAGDEANDLALEFYDWALDKEQRRFLIAALEWYVYSIRERG